MNSVNKKAQELLQFIDASPTAYHAVSEIETKLNSKGFIKLKEKEDWDLKLNSNYYIVRASGSVILFRTPKSMDADTSFKIIGAHTDSPCLKVKSNPVGGYEGYQLLNIEIYGGVLLSSWFDKDLNIGGRIFTETKEGKLESHLIRLPYKVRIPRLAIHLDRNVNNEGFKINPQTQMYPVMGLGEEVDFDVLLAEEIGTKDKILSWDLFLFDAEKCSFGGLNNEFIYAPRLDNLASVHASMDSLLNANNSANHILMATYFNHEEIGSTSQNGANSNFLESTVNRIMEGLNSANSTAQTIARSFFISADMAHAVHPSYASKHDPGHKPYIGKGPVIKSNANIRYATDAYTIARFKQLCNAANISYQDFHTRNDMGCGSTIGPMTSARLGIATVDIGNPMLSMHSIREMAGSEDHESLIKVFNQFYL